MTTSYAMRNFAFGDGLTYGSQDVRLALGALMAALGGSSGNALAVGSGVLDAPGTPLKAAASSGLSVTVSPGFAVIQSGSVNGGGYIATLDATPTLTCATASPTYARIDSVCLTITDLGTSGSTIAVQIVTGTAAASPVAPTLPALSLLLCNINVPANATTLTSGNLTDERQFTAARGGITPYLSSSDWPTVGPSSAYGHDDATSRLKRYSNTAGTLVAPSTVGFAPAYGAAGTVSGAGTAETVSSASVAVDGSTSVRITITWAWVSTAGTTGGNGGVLAASRGGTTLAEAIVYTTGADSNIAGGSAVFYDQTPAAGSYTYIFTVSNQGAGTFQVHAGTITLEAVPS